jgi:hypothetical protein
LVAAANLGLFLVFAIAFAMLISRRLLDNDAWRATVTPLASIIGSGFLVSVPLLSSSVGNWAIAAMTVLVVYAYLVGGAIRFNIRHGEPMFDGGSERPGVRFAVLAEQMSHLALAGAYFISVAYYLSLLSIFLLKGVGVDNDWLARLVTTGLLAFIGLYGFARNLGGLERLEEYAVSLNLAAIAAIIIALAGYNIHLWVGGSWALATLPAAFDGHTLRALFGFIIVVQGFETSRFLADEYSADLRIRTMRRAQIISAVIYMVFFGLATVMFKAHYADSGVAAIIGMVGVIAFVLPLLLTGAAVASQFSASVADAIGGAGLLHQAFVKRLGLKRFGLEYFYPVIAGCAIALVWSSDVFEIIALASRAFAFFYFLQCLVAALVALASKDMNGRGRRAAWYGLLALVSLIAAVFGISSE